MINHEAPFVLVGPDSTITARGVMNCRFLKEYLSVSISTKIISDLSDIMGKRLELMINFGEKSDRSQQITSIIG